MLSLHEEVAKCRKCLNVHEYNRFVIGEGDLDAPVYILGQDPGATELDEGRPFCGPSGKLLRETLDAVGILRKYRFITNMNFHRSRNNSGFSLKERMNCWNGFGRRLLAASEAKVVVLVGAKAAEIVLRDAGIENAPFRSLVGRSFRHDFGHGTKTLTCCFHPAYVLRGGGKGSLRHSEMKRQLEAPARVLADLLAKKNPRPDCRGVSRKNAFNDALGP